VIDVFESNNQQFANRWMNSIGFRLNYQYIPLTLFYLDVTQGAITGIGDSQKVTSYPFETMLGTQTALTAKLAVLGRIGYTHGFYDAGPDYSSVLGSLQAIFHYSELGRVSLMYSYYHQDSINANFFRDHLLQLLVEQDILPFAVFAKGELRFREYDGISEVMGPPTRDDVIGEIVAGARYQFRDWIAASVYYLFTDDQTDYRYFPEMGVQVNPSYVRHELLAGVRAAF
jgi:hypothetical protein